MRHGARASRGERRSASQADRAVAVPAASLVAAAVPATPIAAGDTPLGGAPVGAVAQPAAVGLAAVHPAEHPAPADAPASHAATRNAATGHAATGHSVTGHSATGHSATDHPAHAARDVPAACHDDAQATGHARPDRHADCATIAVSVGCVLRAFGHAIGQRDHANHPLRISVGSARSHPIGLRRGRSRLGGGPARSALGSA